MKYKLENTKAELISIKDLLIKDKWKYTTADKTIIPSFLEKITHIVNDSIGQLDEELSKL